MHTLMALRRLPAAPRQRFVEAFCAAAVLRLGLSTSVDLAALRAIRDRFGANPSPADIMSRWLPLVLDRGLAYMAAAWGPDGATL